jgi:hypothetical protein
MTIEKTERIALSVPVFTDYSGPRMTRRVTIFKGCNYAFEIQLPVPSPEKVPDVYGVTEEKFRESAAKELSYLRDTTALAGIDTNMDWATVSQEALVKIGVILTKGFSTAKAKSAKGEEKVKKEQKVSDSDATKIKYGLSPDASMEELVAAIQAAAVKAATKAVKK